MLNISLKLDLAKIMKTNRQIGTFIIAQFPMFENCVRGAIEGFMAEEGLGKPEHGVHLLVSVANCPLPTQNIKSPEFQLMGFEQSQGVMVYLKDVLVTEVSQQEIFLFCYTETWAARCVCGSQPRVHRNVSRSLLDIIQANVQQEDKLSSRFNSEAHCCVTCSKAYAYEGRFNETYLNCQKLKLLLPHPQDRHEKESVFESLEYSVYGEFNVTGHLQPGCIISCCSYLFCKPVVVKAAIKQPIVLKPEYSAFLMNAQVHSGSANLLTIRPENSSFFY
jgi:hypothetical protein